MYTTSRQITYNLGREHWAPSRSRQISLASSIYYLHFTLFTQTPILEAVLGQTYLYKGKTTGIWDDAAVISFAVPLCT